MESKKLVLVDGHSILNRAFYGMPDLTNAAGLHTGAVFGFLNILFKILDEEKADYLTVAFDVHAPTFRHEVYKEYKGTRKPMPEELREQVPLIKKVLQSMGVQIREQAGLEADDILGTLARRAEDEGMEVALLSGDRDLLQIATDKTCIRIPKTRQGQTVIENYHAADVLEKYRVTPRAFIDVKALMGDSSDNIPGVPKVGEKTATQLIVDYGSVDGVYEHLDEIKKPALRRNLSENEELARLSLFLVTIKTDCDISEDWDEARIGNLYTPEAFKLFTELGFRALLPRFDVKAAQTITEEFSFRVISDRTEAGSYINTLLESIKNADPGKPYRIGVYPVMDPVRYGEKNDGFLSAAAFCVGKTAAFLEIDNGGPEKGLTQDGLMELLRTLRITALKACTGASSGGQGPEPAAIAVFGLKNQFPVWGIDSATEFKDGIRLEGFSDLLIQCYLCNPLQSDYQPEMTASEYLNESCPTWKQVFDKRSMKQALAEKRDELIKYACQMASVLSRAANPVEEKLEQEGMTGLYREIERPLSYILYDMERIGIRIRPEELKHYSTELGEQADALAAKIYEECGEEFNISSPKQLGAILFEKLGMPGGKKTKTGYSTAAGVLEKLAPDYPVVDDILQYRAVTKLKSTYADGLTAFVASDGRIHTSFNQTITATGRISSTDPNLQNIPMTTEMGKTIRKAFIPSEGVIFVDADYSQIELRILAHMSGDKELIDAYKENEDIHRITASKVFHTPFEKVTPLQRRNAKAVNFGIVYGISSFGLSQGLSISRKEAAEYIEAYFRTYPGIKAFLDKLVSDAKEKGYAQTMYGRRRPVPELKSSNFMQRSFGERVAMNSPIQGTAADIIKIAMIRVWEALARENFRSRLILQIHDELLIEAIPEEKEQVEKLLSDEMSCAASLKVALETDVHSGSDWYMAK